jgi:hypothetical protein
MKYNAKQKIGILGGGQLGRMLIQAAISYDVNFYVDFDFVLMLMLLLLLL